MGHEWGEPGLEQSMTRDTQSRDGTSKAESSGRIPRSSERAGGTPDVSPSADLDLTDPETLQERVGRLVELAEQGQWSSAAVEAQRIRLACQRHAHQAEDGDPPTDSDSDPDSSRPA